jgi:hypothetical protein
LVLPDAPTVVDLYKFLCGKVWDVYVYSGKIGVVAPVAAAPKGRCGGVGRAHSCDEIGMGSTKNRNEGTSWRPGPAKPPHYLMQPVQFPLMYVVSSPEERSRYRMVSPLGANCPASGLDGNGSHRFKPGQLAGSCRRCRGSKPPRTGRSMREVRRDCICCGSAEPQGVSFTLSSWPEPSWNSHPSAVPGPGQCSYANSGPLRHASESTTPVTQ